MPAAPANGKQYITINIGILPIKISQRFNIFTVWKQQPNQNILAETSAE